MDGPLKYPGGKHFLADNIIALMPPHLHYVEPFFGGGAVLLERDPNDRRLWIPPHTGVSEVVNDINGDLTRFWRVLQRQELFEEFKRRIDAVPVSRTEWQASHAHVYGTNVIDDAVAFFINCRQSRSGMMKDFSTMTRNRTRRKMNAASSEWLSAIEGLPEIHARLMRVVIESMNAVDLIIREDTPTTLFYCDPPYLPETRVTTDFYRYEMTVDQHAQLLTTLLGCKGMVMISGYASDLYDKMLTGWGRHIFSIPNHAAGGKKKRRMEEVLWLSPNCSRSLGMPILSILR